LGKVASGAWVAQIFGARISVDTSFWNVGASKSWRARVVSASASVIAVDVGVGASTGWVARIGGAFVAVVTISLRPDTSSSVDVDTARVNGTCVSIITSWASASSSAGAESFASSSAWVGEHFGTGLFDQICQQTVQSRKGTGWQVLAWRVGNLKKLRLGNILSNSN